MQGESSMNKDELAAIMAKEAAAIKQALNFGTSQEWAIDIGEPVKEAWAEDYMNEKFQPVYNTMMEKNFQELEELSLTDFDGDGEDPKSKSENQNLFAELRRRGIDPNDFAGADDDDDDDADDGFDHSDAGGNNKDKDKDKAEKRKVALAAKEKLAWAMLTKSSDAKGSLQKTVEGALDDMQAHIDSKDAGNNFLHNQKNKKKGKKKKMQKSNAKKKKKKKKKRDTADL